ncbi:hypothetical protein HDU82_004979 [Entophlyctis luteolus]|nr:hypothetical protein HDU82_004979 [Entophlyctis luteolus]
MMALQRLPLAEKFQFGDNVMIKNAGTNGYLSVDLPDTYPENVSESDVFHLTTATADSKTKIHPSARNVMKLVPVDRYARIGFVDQIPRYGEKFYIVASDALVDKPLYLCSEQKNFARSSRKLRLQAAYLCFHKDSRAEWQIIYPDPELSLEMEGQPVPVGEPVIIHHPLTGVSLGSEASSKTMIRDSLGHSGLGTPTVVGVGVRGFPNFSFKRQMDDPYFGVKQDIEAALANAAQLHTNLRRLLKAPPLGQDKQSEFLWTREELSSLVVSISEDLADLSNAVAAVAQNPARFNLDSKAVSQRKEFVARVQREIDEIKATLERKQRSPSAGKKQQPASPSPSSAKISANISGKQDRDRLLQSGDAAASKSRSASSMNNDKFADRENGIQQMIMKDQDQQLDSVAMTVMNMKEIAIVMNQELDDQTASVLMPRGWRGLTIAL